MNPLPVSTYLPFYTYVHIHISASSATSTECQNRTQTRRETFPSLPPLPKKTQPRVTRFLSQTSLEMSLPRSQPSGLPPEPSFFVVLSLPCEFFSSSSSSLQEASTQQVVKKAYRRALLRHHPDKQRQQEHQSSALPSSRSAKTHGGGGGGKVDENVVRSQTGTSRIVAETRRVPPSYARLREGQQQLRQGKEEEAEEEGEENVAAEAGAEEKVSRASHHHRNRHNQQHFTIDQITTAYATLISPSARSTYVAALASSPSLSSLCSFFPDDSLSGNVNRHGNACEYEYGPGDVPQATGVETVDLDDLEHHQHHHQHNHHRDPDGDDDHEQDEGANGRREATSVWTRPCRCGNDRGFELSEDDLEHAISPIEPAAPNEPHVVSQAHRNHSHAYSEILVGCKDCSLWLRVNFSVVVED